jgi:hypothetical protein
MRLPLCAAIVLGTRRRYIPPDITRFTPKFDRDRPHSWAMVEFSTSSNFFAARWRES